MPGLERLGRYEVIAEIGQGQMGTVYKAIDPRLDRVVALKVVRLDPADLESRDFRQRFQAEARSAGRLSHPNIVIVYDFGEVNDMAYIAMEFLRGETLRSMLDRQRFSTRRAVRYAGQIAEGLAAAHAEGVVHRDIKPANVVRLPNGLLKITDFGIARMPASHLTQDGTLLGTPKYMSPEQVKSLRVDGRSDIFSLGVLLYEMLTATLPFGGSTLSEVMNQIAHDRPIHPLRWNAAIPESVVRIMAKCLAKDPEARYQNVGDVARDLRIHKVMDVARDALIDDVFLPVDPGAASTRSESSAPAPSASSKSSDSQSPSRAFDKTMPMNTLSASAGMSAPHPESSSHRRVTSPRVLGAVAIAGAFVIAAVATAMMGHKGAPVAAPALPVPVVVAPPPAASEVAPADLTKVSTESAVEGVDTPAPDTAPVAVKLVHRRPKPKPDPTPVAAVAPTKIESLAPLPEAPKAVPQTPVSDKAAKDAAFEAELRRQQNCLRTNRCE